MVINISIDRDCPIMSIYCIQNISNNKRYIGSSVNLLVRLEKHRSLLRGNRHENKYLQNAWNKYGEEKFICYLLEVYDSDVKDYLTEHEQKWVDLLSPEYNLILKVERNELTSESRLKQSETRKRLFKEGKLIPSSYKAVKKYDLDANFIAEYKSVNDAAESENLHVTTVIRNLQKTTNQGGGFIWRYVSDDSEVLPMTINYLRSRYGYKTL
jgi:hypothetical protein